MATEDFKRKLTAIFSADVAGYSRLMGEDEAATVKTLANYREVMASLIKQHRGRVVDSPGDNVLAEFVSVVDAVQCAVAVQKELQTRNAELLENRKMEFRIGINLGDVIDEEDRIYGDGVNIAARLEALADPGGICISKTAFDQIETKLPLGYEFLGEQEVKNIAKPVGAYKVLMDAEAAGKVIGEIRPKAKQLRWAVIGGVVVLILVAGALAIWNFYLRPTFEPASTERMAFPLPDEPSIMVMPFENLSGDPAQEYFSDGLTLSIITQLYKIPNLFVVHRASSLAYKDKKLTPQQIAEEMGVRYVVEGGVQKAGNRIRLNVQLIDAVKGRQLWAESYDRELEDVFGVQDEITRKVVTEMAVKISWGEQARGWTHMTENYEALDLFYEADKLYMRFEKESNAKARELLVKAIELDPKFARAIAFLGLTHLQDSRSGWVKNRKQSINKAEELAKRALTVDDNLYLAHGLLSSIYVRKRLYKEAIAAGERGVEAEPNNATAILMLAGAMLSAGRPEEGLILMKKAMRLAPHPPLYFYPYAVFANYLTGRYEATITHCKKFLKRQQQDSMALFLWQWLIASYMELGREEEARAEAQRLLEQHPNASIEGFTDRVKRGFKDVAFLDHQTEILRKAGIPETPPLPLPDKPSIAVLPFVNMSGDPEQEYFSDGITEQIISSISKLPRLFVISRTSSFKYKGKAVDVKQVGRELGVKYVLEGSVQRSGDRLRITAQLIDAMTGKHLWAERYDRRFKDLFALQDEITMRVMLSLAAKLTEGERLRLRSGRKGTDNLKALEKLFEAVPYLRAFNIESNVTARQLSEEVITLDPEFAAGYDMLACTHFMDVYLGSSKSPRKSLVQATELLHKAISLDENYSSAYSHLCHVYGMQRQYEKAIAEGEKAVALNPNSDSALVWLGMAMDWVGRSDEAIALYKKAMRLCPFPPSFYYLQLGHAYRSTERYKEAITEYNKALHLTPNNVFAFSGLAICYSLSGQEEEARAAAAEILTINPNFSLKGWSMKLSYRDETLKERWRDALHKAGLK